MTTSTTVSLKEKWAELKSENPRMRIRNAAEALGVAEVALLATQIEDIAANGENKVIRLKPEFQNILKEIESLGKVMGLTRNDDVVHERKGIYLNAELESPHVGLFVGEDIDLRIFFAGWESAFAVQESLKDKPRYSLQFFAKDGSALHKIYLTPLSNVEAYLALVDKYTAEDQTAEQAFGETKPLPVELPDAEIDVEGFQAAWLELKDTHEFFGMLRKYKVTRTQALRLAPKGNYAVQISNDGLRNVITKAAENQTPIMVFVGNSGMIQIHTGTVKKLMDHDGWFNVLDPDFNLHVKEASIVQTWVVRKPAEGDMVTALECFNDKGEIIAQLFGKRKPGIPELASWREIVSAVEATSKI